MFTVASFLAVTTALNVVLGVLVTVRKVRRDRRERRHAHHRDELRRALAVGGNELDRLLRRAGHRTSALIDLAQVLPGVVRAEGDWVIGCVKVAAGKAGLTAALERRVRSRRAAVRGTAALLIGLLRLPLGAELVRPLLHDRDGDVRLVAADALGTLATGQAAAFLIDALADRALADERLVERLGAPWATGAILARLESGTDSTRVRSSLARALGLSGDRRGEVALVDMLDSPHLEVRVNATRALATCGTDACIDAVLRRLDDPAWQVRAQAAASLGALDAHVAVPALAEHLHHPAWWVRANAAAALVRLGDDGVVALQRAADGPDAYAAERALEVLAQRGAA